MPADFCFRTAHSLWRDSIHIGQTILCLDPLLLNDNVMVGLRVERIWNGRGNIGMRIIGNGVVGMAWYLTWRTGAGREGGRAEAEVGAENEGEETGTATVIGGATTASDGRSTDEVLKRLSSLSCLFRVSGVDNIIGKIFRMTRMCYVHNLIPVSQIINNHITGTSYSRGTCAKQHWQSAEIISIKRQITVAIHIVESPASLKASRTSHVQTRSRLVQKIHSTTPQRLHLVY
jgi:hypothetical protein